MEQAFWLREPGQGELRETQLRTPNPDEVLVRTRYSAISRGTEALVFRGGVPESQHATMRAPFQEGDFPGPVKYGYLNVGTVESGPPNLLGRTVFCLYPHQTRYVVPATAVTVVPEHVPAERAVLAGTVETALNAVWDAEPQIGDRIAVIGAGMVGAAVAGILGRLPATEVQLVDIDPTRAEIAAALGVGFATPNEASEGCDIAVHASASEQGLERALELLRPEGVCVELSWYGDRRVSLPLGEWFHSRRLTIRSSQVGTVSPNRPRSYAQRLAVALDLLADPRFDALVTSECRFGELPAALPKLISCEPSALCLRVTYDSD